MGEMVDELMQHYVESCQWMTNRGEVLDYDEISDSHLRNIIGFLERRYMTRDSSDLEKLQLKNLRKELSSRP